MISTEFMQQYIVKQKPEGYFNRKRRKSAKKIGTEARKDLENIVEKKVFLGLEVKIEKDWRKKQSSLKNFGYEQEK